MGPPNNSLQDRNGEETLVTPTAHRLIVAHGNPEYAAQVGRQFRRLGWEVHTARSGSEVRRLARTVAPQLVVLGAETPQETGWLTCAKLAREQPRCRIILVSRDPTPEYHRMARFVGGAALVQQDAGAGALLDEVYGEANLPAVG